MRIIFISDKSLKGFEEKLIETAKKYKIIGVKEDKIDGYYVASVSVKI